MIPNVMISGGGGLYGYQYLWSEDYNHSNWKELENITKLGGTVSRNDSGYVIPFYYSNIYFDSLPRRCDEYNLLYSMQDSVSIYRNITKDSVVLKKVANSYLIFDQNYSHLNSFRVVSKNQKTVGFVCRKNIKMLSERILIWEIRENDWKIISFGSF